MPERIFRRYERGADRPAGSGLGLGLPIVAAIATAHGGQVRLNQVAGRGARFEIVLPLAGAVVGGTTLDPRAAWRSGGDGASV